MPCMHSIHALDARHACDACRAWQACMPCKACNAMPGVFCGLVIDPTDAFLFAQINDGNAISMPYAKGFGWAAELNLQCRKAFAPHCQPEAHPRCQDVKHASATVSKLTGSPPVGQTFWHPASQLAVPDIAPTPEQIS